jgi:multiple sugar transport system substrate-binding protein
MQKYERSNLMKKLISLALIITLLALALTGCASSTTTTAAQATSAAGSTSNETSSQNLSGSEIKILLVSHTFVDALQPLIPEFEQATGIKVSTEVLAEGPAFEKLLADLSSGTGEYDLFMTSPINNWQYVSGGWVEPLDDYIADPAKTPADWNIDDFVPGILNAGRWTGEPLKGVGEGSLYELPVNYESYMLTYRPSLIKKYGLKVPNTYEEMAQLISSLKGQDLADANGQKIFPIVTRFDKYWDLTYLTFGTMLQTYGVNLIDEDGKVGIASPESIAATKLFVQMIQEGSPEGAGLFTWYEALQGFASGQYLFSLNEADGFASTYENPEQSQVADDVGYAMTPTGPGGSRSASIWVWGMSMNSASQNKDAAWQFLQWATSRETMIQTHLAGNMNPVRKSAWEDPEVAAMVNSWGESEGQFLSVVQGMAEVASLQLPAHPEITRILDIWAEAVQKAYYGEMSVEDSLAAAAKQIEAILG